MNLKNAQVGQEYIIRAIETNDEELDAFLFSLGCYSGEPITVVSHKKNACVVSIKDARYTIDLSCSLILSSFCWKHPDCPKIPGPPFLFPTLQFALTYCLSQSESLTSAKGVS